MIHGHFGKNFVQYSNLLTQRPCLKIMKKCTLMTCAPPMRIYYVSISFCQFEVATASNETTSSGPKLLPGSVFTFLSSLSKDPPDPPLRSKRKRWLLVSCFLRFTGYLLYIGGYLLYIDGCRMFAPLFTKTVY